MAESSSSWDFTKINNLDEFKEMFWNRTNGNDLIRELNKYAHGEKMEDRIRREKEAPAVYAIVLNNFQLKSPNENLKFVKVGFTHKTVEKESDNRMEQ